MSKSPHWMTDLITSIPQVPFARMSPLDTLFWLLAFLLWCHQQFKFPSYFLFTFCLFPSTFFFCVLRENEIVQWFISWHKKVTVTFFFFSLGLFELNVNLSPFLLLFQVRIHWGHFFLLNLYFMFLFVWLVTILTIPTRLFNTKWSHFSLNFNQNHP